MNIKRKLKNDLKALDTPPMERVLPAPGSPTTERSHSPRRPLGVMVTVAVLACLLIVGAVAAIPEIVKWLNAPEVVESSYKLTDVPTGWVGIYTLDDLEMLRQPEYQNTNFVLMNDIVIPNAAYSEGGRYANGFQPLGIYVPNESEDQNFYMGSFNGNGYTISNLKIVPSDYSVYYSGKMGTVGLFGYTTSKITFLGVRDVEITLNSTRETDSVYVGALAAKADYVAGCYAENVSIRYNCAGNVKETVAVGALCGRADYLDSCYVKNGDVQVLDNGTGKTMLVGGIAGTSYSCVTSYFLGNVTVTAPNYGTCLSNRITAMLYPAYTPVLLGDESMKIVRQKLEESVDQFDYDKFLTYYVEFDREKIEASKNEKKKQALIAYFEYLNSVSGAFYTEDKSEERIWWVFVSDASMDEIGATTSTLVEAFGGVENFEAFCIEQNIKCGQLYCYSFDKGSTVTTKNLPHFDFESLWIETENGVALRIFEQ